MIKLTFCLRRRPDLSPEQFYDYWKNTHGPLVAARADALKIRKYQQVHTMVSEADTHAALQRRNGGAPAPFDGIAEVWVDSLDDFRGTTPEARAAAADLLADEKNFIDLPNSPMWLGETHVFVDRTGDREEQQ